MTMLRKGFVALAVPIILSLAGCGDDDDAGSSDAATDAGSNPLVVTWDEAGCVYEGPAEVTAGLVAVDLVNNGEDSANLYVMKLDEGTVQDVMDAFVPEPRTTAFSGSVSDAVRWSDMGALAPVDPGETLQWEKDLAPGEYVLICNRSRPIGQWFGGAFIVGEG